MIILKTQGELQNVRHVKGEGYAFQCGDCGKVEELGLHGISTGYGYMERGPEAKPICFDCCGKRDVASMQETGKATLYLTRDKETASWQVSNWPGTYKRAAFVRTGRHNIAGKRYDAWFTGPDGFLWHGVTYGDMTQICHCKRTKTKA